MEEPEISNNLPKIQNIVEDYHMIQKNCSSIDDMLDLEIKPSTILWGSFNVL